jgi:hypothetical protein
MTVVSLRYVRVADPLDVARWRKDLAGLDGNVWAIGDGAEVAWWTEETDQEIARQRALDAVVPVVGRGADRVEVFTDEEFEVRAESLPEIDFRPLVIVDRYWGF